MYFSSTLHKFLDQAKTDNLKTKHFQDRFNGLKVKVSFGAGNQAKIPWISFLGDDFKTSEGIYPVYLLYKSQEILVLAYGISETNEPKVSWGINDQYSIKDYFDKNGLRGPFRYGDSYVYKVYDLNELPSDKILDKDLSEILSKYKSIINNLNKVEGRGGTQEGLMVKDFVEDLETRNIKLHPNIIYRFISSLLTKPFVLLTGLSGSGKTKLAQSFAQWISEDENQYSIVPVGADWVNSEPLLGYVNALDQDEYIVPENGALELIIEANENPQKPYFLILDEMNLSHVERYFADFLSVMETEDEFKLHSSEESKDCYGISVDSTFPWPDNLFIIGTVNIDETTYMFSPKVLDRANVIEFRVNSDQMEEFLEDTSPIEEIDNGGASMGKSFVDLAGSDFESSDEIKGTLVNFFDTLKKVGAEFGFRTAKEIVKLHHRFELIDSDFGPDDKMDAAIMQKLLPKLHGSRRKLKEPLQELAKLCVEDDGIESDKIFNEVGLRSGELDIKYSVSFDKIERMYRALIRDGFASYAEA